MALFGAAHGWRGGGEEAGGGGGHVYTLPN